MTRSDSFAMSLSNDPRSRFIEAACVPLEASHASGTLDEANALLAAYPEIAHRDVHTAAILGDAPAVRRFIANDPSCAIRKSGPRDWNALTHLCFSRYLRLDPGRAEGFVDAARVLLEAGASANSGWFESRHTPRPVWESVLYGAAGIARHAGLTRLLLAHGADPNDEETPYHTPETYDNAALEAMVESGKLNADSLATLLLRKADWHDHAGIVYLLTHGADPNRMTRWHYTPFQQALRRDNALAIIEAFLDRGAAPGAAGLAIAVRRGRHDVLEALERRGVPVASTGVDELIAACARDDAASVQAIAEREPDLVRELLANGATLLAEFAGNGNTAGVRHLLDLGVPVDARYAGDGYYGIARNSTALHVSTWRIRPATARLLVERGANVDALDAAGRTPLQLAVRACVESYWRDRRTPEIAAVLLAAGASTRGITLPTGYDAIDDLLRRYRSRSSLS